MCRKLCKEQNFVLKGKDIVLRSPKMRDAKGLLTLVNSLVAEDAPILVNRKFTLKEERKLLLTQLKMIRKGRLHHILANHNGEIVGSIQVRRDRLYRQSHVADIGISVKKNYRMLGLGTLLLRRAIEVAKKDLGIKVLTLGFAEPNKALASKLYKRLGFRMVAKLPKRFLYKGRYVDGYIMDYPLRRA